MKKHTAGYILTPVFLFSIALAVTAGFYRGNISPTVVVSDPIQDKQTAVIYASTQESIASLAFVDEDIRLIAQRAEPEGAFAVHVAFADDAEPLFCTTSPTLNGLLPELTHIQATERLSKDTLFQRFSIKIGALMLISPLFPDEDVTEFYTNDHASGTGALAYGKHAWEISTPSAAVFSSLKKLCTTSSQ